MGTTHWVRTGGHWHPDGVGARADAVWVRAAPGDLSVAAARLGVRDVLPHLEESTRAGRSRPHLELLPGGGVHLVVPTLALHDPSDVVTGEVACLVTGSVVITSEQGEAGVLDRLEARLGQPQTFVDRLTGGLLSGLLGAVLDCAVDVEDALEQAVRAVESVVFSPREDAPVTRVYELKREVAEARRALAPLGVELPELLTDPEGSARADAWGRRLIGVVDRLDRRLEGHDKLLADMLAAHLALVSVAQNVQMRRISAWAATLAVPTLVGAIYGMNFARMPELHWAFGYPYALGLMAVVSLAVNLAFRRSGWL